MDPGADCHIRCATIRDTPEFTGSWAENQFIRIARPSPSEFAGFAGKLTLVACESAPSGAAL